MADIKEICRKVELRTELYITLGFMIVSGLYIFSKFGVEKLMDSMFLWMFPASLMIFLTILTIILIEKIYHR